MRGFPFQAIWAAVPVPAVSSVRSPHAASAASRPEGASRMSAEAVAAPATEEIKGQDEAAGNGAVESMKPPEIAPAPPAEPKKEPDVNKLFRMVMKFEGSDLHLKVGLAPMMRLRGVIRRMEMRPLS